jgi:hypothetical protein
MRCAVSSPTLAPAHAAAHRAAQKPMQFCAPCAPWLTKVCRLEAAERGEALQQDARQRGALQGRQRQQPAVDARRRAQRRDICSIRHRRPRLKEARRRDRLPGRLMSCKIRMSVPGVPPRRSMLLVIVAMCWMTFGSCVVQTGWAGHSREDTRHQFPLVLVAAPGRRGNAALSHARKDFCTCSRATGETV